MLLIDYLEKNTKDHPEKPALIMRMGYRTLTLTYKDVYDLSLKIACFLEKNGIQKDDKVLIFAPNSPYWILIFWGTLLRGAILVPLNVQSTPEMIEKITNQTGAKIIFKTINYKDNLPPNLKSFDIELIGEEIENLDASSFQKSPQKEDDIVEIMYTSGTTGDPKGVLLTNKNIYSNVETVSQVIPLSKKDKFLSILPLSHIFEQVAGFLLPFSHSSEIVYAHSSAAIRELLHEHEITKMAAVPEFLRVVMSKIEARAEEEGRKKIFENMLALSSKIGLKLIQRLIFYSIHREFGGRLKTVASGGAPLDPELEKKWDALGVTLLQGYGLTETSPVVSTNTYQNRRIGSVGKILPGVEVKIASDGEILVKGSNVFQGYFSAKGGSPPEADGPRAHASGGKNEEKTKESFTLDGWFRTGDIGELDQDGFLYLKGRKKYLLKGPGAQNIFPEDIEFELSKIHGVKDSAVVGLEKPGGEIQIHAVLLPEKPFDRIQGEKIIEEANRKLATYQQITGWSLWPKEDFPRSATRKVKKEEVLQWLKNQKIGARAGLARLEASPPVKLLAEITGQSISEIKNETKIVPELNLDSLLRVVLVSRIEEKFGVEIDEAKITPQTTVFELEEMIKTAAPIEKRYFFKKRLLSGWTSILRIIIQNLIVFSVLRIFTKLEIKGDEFLQSIELPAVFMPNHVSYLDSAALAMALPFRIRKNLSYAAAKDVLYVKYKSVAWLVELIFNTFPFPRQEGENIKSGLDYMGRMLDKNFSVVIYPEGKLSESGALMPLKKGAGLVAVEMNSFIVPVKISGTSDIVPYGKIIPRRRGLVTVEFGRPFKFSRRDSYLEATEKIQKMIGAL